jgi:hypothetical protein
MALLEDITPGALVKGLLPGANVTVISIKLHGFNSVELVYKDAQGHLGSELLYGDGIANLEIAAPGLPWSFDADGALFRLTSEAYRMRLAYLYDPLIAVHTSLIELAPQLPPSETMLGDNRGTWAATLRFGENKHGWPFNLRAPDSRRPAPLSHHLSRQPRGTMAV